MNISVVICSIFLTIASLQRLICADYGPRGLSINGSTCLQLSDSHTKIMSPLKGLKRPILLGREPPLRNMYGFGVICTDILNDKDVFYTIYIYHLDFVCESVSFRSEV